MADPLPIPDAPPPEPIPVVGPDGTIGTLDADSAQAAFQPGSGYRPATAEEIAKEQWRQDHDSVIKAGALGFARGGTAGLSDLFLTKSGAMTPESIKAYKEESPWTSGLTQGAGFLLPAIATGGATAELGTLGRVAVDAGLGGLASAGGDISEAALGDHNLNAEKVLADIGLGTAFGGAGSVGVRVAEKVVPEAFGYARKALSELSGQLVKTTGKVAVGLGADAEDVARVVGNQAGAVAPGGLEAEAAAAEGANVANMAEYKAGKQALQENQGKALQSSVVKAVDGIDDAQRTFDATTRPAVAESLLKGSDMAVVKRGAMNALDTADETLKAAMADPLSNKKTLGAAEDLLAATRKTVWREAETPEEIHDAMLDLKRQQAKLAYPIKGTPYEVSLQDPTIGPMRDVQSMLKVHMEDPAAYGTKLAAKNAEVNAAESQAINWRKAMMKTFGAQDWDEMGHSIKEMSPDKFRTFLNAEAKGTREPVSSMIDNWQKAEGHLVDVMEDHTLSVNQKPIGREGLQDLLKQVSAAKESEQTTAEALRQGLPKPEAVAPSGPATSLAALKAGQEGGVMSTGAVGFAAHALGLPIAPITALAALKTAPGTTLETMIRAAQAIDRTTAALNTGVKALLGSAPVRMAVVTHGMHSLDLGNGVPPGATAQDQLDHHRTTLGQIAAQGSAAVQPMPQLQGAMPFTAAALSKTALAQVQALNGTMPKPPDGQQIPALEEPFKASQQSTWEFDEMARVVKDPTSVLQRVAAGVESPQALAAFKVLWPEMYRETSAKLIDGLKKLDKPISFDQKQKLSAFLNTPLDSSLKPMNLMGLQGNFIAPPPAPKRPLSSGLQKLNLAGSEMTQGQAATAHLGKG